ncbi:WD40-repeat-containing domain protein, partial [Hysterangium stoloniferum]
IVTTRPILNSFVSSNKSDVYQLRSQDSPLVPNLAFACAFSRDGKKGGKSVLAIATQEGLVELLDVRKRRDWDPEPPRTSIPIHQNAILDVKWGVDDQYIGTASGDKTARVTSVTTQQCLAVLAHHTNSVKTLDWDPCHPDILSTGGRDGSICVWDVRDSRRGDAGADTLSPVITISRAHWESPCGKNAKNVSDLHLTVTSIVYIPNMPRQLISGGSYDGKLKQWDLRYPVTGRERKPVPISESHHDPTFSPGSRSRGLSSLTLGRNRTAGLIWGVAADSCVHTYSLPLTAPNSAVTGKLSHPGLFVKSFYVKVALNPCGEWLATGSSSGGVYLWDVASRGTGARQAVELKPTGKEIGALDWTDSSLATCCDDGTVRLWRPNLDVSMKCKSDPEESKWDWTWTTDDL